MEYHDVMGQPLEQGDVIVYGVAGSGRVSMSLGIIVAQAETDAGMYRGPRPCLQVLRTSARPFWEKDLKVSRATVTELQRVVKVHPAYYNEVVAVLQAAAETPP